MDALPFLLVDEAIKKNKASVKLQEYVALMVWERARVEQTYIKNLTGWAEKIVKEGKEFQDDEVFQVIADILPGEAELTAAAHQRVYHQMLEDSGPYNILYRDMGLREGIFHYNCRGVVGIEEEFVKENRKRVNLETVHSQRKQAMQDCKTKLDTLESQMTCRSRLATRRSSKGRRVDSLMNKMIEQKRRYDVEVEGSDAAERELESLFQGKKITLLEMLKDLNVLEKDRVQLIFSQLIEFMTRLRHIEMPEESATRRHAMNDMLRALSNVNVRSVADASWQKMERAAKARKVGAVFSLRDLVSPSPAPATARPHAISVAVRSPSGPPGIILPPNGGTPIPPPDTRKRGIRPRDREKRTKPPRNKSPVVMTSVHVFEPPSDSSSEESVSKEILLKRQKIREEKEPERVILFTRPAISDTSVRSDDIETIYLPEEDIPAYKPPAPFPPRLFCPSLSDDDEDREDDFADEPIIENASPATRFAFDASNVRLYAKPLSSESEEELEEKEGEKEEDNIALMRGVRVIALHPYTARTTDQLSFKQNQVIKQKLGANDEGFAYGWTRETKLSQKQHGWYPQALVKLMVPQPGRSNKRSE
ncbi:uncharacterized protein LOC117336848 isoform X2 [Pecten maximus]|uniref:uncharacterized protein LOC117336848 isoform X2 n=1 Tax=Pecten maximus TaxID=6579 RepID=UPI001458EA4F|nr:uncharacterized protein LOC117336848 isoform X2 [Pecten maximus]